jgi:hypothetical protein
MDYYLFPIDNAAITAKNFYPHGERLTIQLYSNLTTNFIVGDYLLLAQQTEKYILPYIFSIVNINKEVQTLVIKVEAVYAQTLPLQAVLSLISLTHRETYDPPSSGYDKLSQPVFEAIVEFMSTSKDGRIDNLSSLDKVGEQVIHFSYSGISKIEVEEGDEEDEIIFSEEEVLDYVKDHIRNRGYYFQDETLYNYHICLKTRPFVILAGLSGTGKSKLARLYAEALGHHEHFKRLSVHPNWNDDRYLLGHYNTLTGEYVTEPTIEFILDAIKHHKNLYSLCLDEMYGGPQSQDN